MKVYFIQSTKSQLDRFEALKHTIKLRNSTKDLTAIIAEMLAVVKTTDYELLASQYPAHFSSSPVDWQMENEIAVKILSKEMHNERMTYIFELTNYCFYYLLLPPKFKSTFFLLHGMTVAEDMVKWNDLLNTLKVKPYIVYKGGQELVTSYLFSQEEIDDNAGEAIENLRTFYSIQSDELNSADIERIFVVQARKGKR